MRLLEPNSLALGGYQFNCCVQRQAARKRRGGIVKLSRFGRDEVQRARLHATAVALRHCAAASDRKIRRVERETRCR